jgi:hypothetical protein
VDDWIEDHGICSDENAVTMTWLAMVDEALK